MERIEKSDTEAEVKPTSSKAPILREGNKAYIVERPFFDN